MEKKKNYHPLECRETKGKTENHLETDASAVSQQTTAQVQIDLQDIMTLVEKLGPSGKIKFLHNLSEQENISENVLKLLINESDSTTLYNLCANAQISGMVLELLVQKLIGITKGTEKVPMDMTADEHEEFYEENENEDEDEQSEQKNETLPIVGQIDIFAEFLFKNHNLTSQQIEDIMENYQGGMNHRFQVNLCSHPNTPSRILERIYEINPTNMKDLVYHHPNLSKEFIDKIQTNKEQDKKINTNADEVDAIVKKHPGLDIYQVLQYYENKKDEIISKKIAEYLCYDKLGHFRYGAKIQYEKLPFKLQLVQKYDLGEELKLRILYSMLGDNIVDHGTLKFYEYTDKPMYFDIPEIEARYGVKLEEEKIKLLCKTILEEMKSRCTPRIEDIEHIYQMSESLGVEIPESIKKYYIDAIIDAIGDFHSRHLSSNDEYKSLQHFQKSLQLILGHKNLFSEQELQQYVMTMDKKLPLPLNKHYLEKMIAKSDYQDGSEEVKILEGFDIFALIERLGLFEGLRDYFAKQQLKKCLAYDHDKGKQLMKRFNITKADLIDLIVHYDLDGHVRGRNFTSEGQYSLDECLDKYGISPDEVIPSLMGDMLYDMIDYIKQKDYSSAQKIIDKYAEYISDKPEFQEHIETLKILTKKK